MSERMVTNYCKECERWARVNEENIKRATAAQVRDAEEIARLREVIKRIEDLIVRFWWAKDNTGAFEAMQSEALRIKAEREGR